MIEDDFFIPITPVKNSGNSSAYGDDEFSQQLHIYLNRAMIDELFCNEILMDDELPDYLEDAILEIGKSSNKSKRVWYGIMNDGTTVVVKDGEKHYDRHFTCAQFIPIIYKKHELCLVCDAFGVVNQELNTFATARLGHLLQDHNMIYGPIFITSKP